MRPCAELSAADWLLDSDQPWERLVGLGPSGFPAYARLRFLPDPAYRGQSENDAGPRTDAPTETEQLRLVLETLARHTRTPAECYFCLWDGWGSYVDDTDDPHLVTSDDRRSYREESDDPHLSTGDGSRSYREEGTGAGPGTGDGWRSYPQESDRVGPETDAPVPGIAPTVRRSTWGGPKLVLPHRAYYLFRGTVADLGDWGPAEMWPGRPRAHVPDPAFIWPADRAWCLANDVDPHWAGIGADRSAIDQLVADPRLDVVGADPGEDPPRYR